MKDKDRKERTITPKTEKHEGKSFGKCIKCNKKFKLKRKTKHKSYKVIRGICSECGIEIEKRRKKR